jgi:lipopolysaccharide transport system ATP-binding protein
MKEIVLHIENVSKKYRLGSIGSATLKRDLQSLFSGLIKRKDLSSAKIDNNDLKSIGDEYVWALQNISFEVPKGEVLGIIGKNGAGKSTLLKILSKVTAPTIGQVKIKGRIASLLEVGTGFHEELTGKENIFLNGAILGMSKAEIKSKLEEIIDFAGVAKYIDTPVKRYSSGMRVRLGFAVAAFLEPEILIVDEVLAVGDAEFQKKAIGKMQDVSSQEGRTVLFVSHNMNSIVSLCSSCLLLKNGSIHSSGRVENIVNEYLQLNNVNQTKIEWAPGEGPGDDLATMISARMVNKQFEDIVYAGIHHFIGFEFEYLVKETTGFFLVPGIHLYTLKEECVFVSSQAISEELKASGIHKTTIWIPENFLNQNIYSVRFSLSSMNPPRVHISVPNIISFETVEDVNLRSNEYKQKIPGIIRPLLNWESTLIR